MKLSPAFLAYKLSSAFSVLAPENLPLSGTLELPVLYQTGSAATAHRVFLCIEEQIGSLSSLPEESSSLFLLCTEELPEELPAPVSIAVKSSVSAVLERHIGGRKVVGIGHLTKLHQKPAGQPRKRHTEGEGS